MKINFYLRNPEDKSVETPIEFIVQSGFVEIDETGKKIYKRIRRSTGLAIKPKDWNENTQTARESFNNYVEINSKLSEIKSYLNKIEREFHEISTPLTASVLKSKLDIFFKGDATKLQQVDLISFIENLFTNKENTPHKRILQQTFRIIKEFSHETNYKIDFDTITMDFYNKFDIYLNKQGYKKNTKAKHISNIKYFMSQSMEDKRHDNTDFEKFKVQRDKNIASIYLNNNEIKTIYNLDLSINPRLDKTRDLFLIGCYTGLRFSDFTQILPENIKGDFIFIKTQKTDTPVVIPLNVETKEIINKYSGKFPKAISNQKMNEYLKEIAQLAGLNEPILIYESKGNTKSTETKLKYELVCTHTARRSFATNCYKAKIPAKQIMLITGHTTESEFFKYIAITGEENAELLLTHEHFRPKLKIAQ